MDHSRLVELLQIIGSTVPPASKITLVGGCALSLLGSSRPTIDIDFLGDDVHPNDFHRALLQLASELNIYMEAVPLDRFIPLPDGSESRAIHIGQFDNLEVFIADPYSIALSKVDRGFDTDFDDIIFLIQNNFINLAELEKVTQKALEKAREFDMNSTEVIAHIQELKKRL
jgi:hypothetical protein